MPHDVFVVGLSWKTAKVSLRERLAISDSEVSDVLSGLLQLDGLGEAMILSTCNRVEVFGCTPTTAPNSAASLASAEVRAFLSRTKSVSSEDLAGSLYELSNDDAIKHIFMVGSALDSLVVGEPQILGQLKASYGAAAEARAIGPVLGRCLETAFRVAKRVRSETGVSRGAANVSTVAVELAKRVFGDLAGRNVLLLGAGKMSTLAARHLRADGAGMLVVANRSADKAERLAAEIDAVARPWESLKDLLIRADVVITSTASEQPILTSKLMAAAARARRYRPLVIVDIAVPRDAEPSVGKLDGVYLFDVDDLQQIVHENLKERASEAEAAERLVAAEVREFATWVRNQSVVPVVRAIRTHFHEVSEREVEVALAQMTTSKSASDREAIVRRLGQRIANKLLHGPMTAMKDPRGSEEVAVVVRQLFGIDEEVPGQEPSSLEKLDPEKSQ